MRSARKTAVRVVTGALATAVLTGCSSSFFQISKENGEAPSSAPPPSAPTAKAPPRDTARRQPARPSSAPAAAAPAQASSRPDSTQRTVGVGTLDVEPVAQASDSTGIERLVQLATVWSTIANFHPWISTRGIAWDSALVRAVPKVRTARSNGELQSALSELVSVLDDPATRFVGAPPSIPAARPFSSAVTADSVLLIVVPTSVASDAAASVARELAELASRAGRFARVVIDVRGTGATGGTPSGDQLRARSLVDASGLAGALTTDALWTPAVRRRVVGTLFTDSVPTEFAIGGAPSAWRSDAAAFVNGTAPQLTRPAPPQKGRNRQPLPPLPVNRNIVVVANEHSLWPLSVAALVANDKAALFADGSTSDANSAPAAVVRLSGTGSLRIRLGELAGQGGLPALDVDNQFAASATVPAAIDSSASSIAAAMKAVRTGPIPMRSARAIAPSELPAVFDSAAYPSMGARLLGVFRLWTALRTLHANRDAYDEDLEEQFRKAIAMAEAARSPREYAAALISLAASTDDSGVQFKGASFDDAFGLFAMPIEAKWVTDRPVVARVANDAAARASGIAVGDEITAVEGFPIVAWLVETRRARPASNEWSRLAEQMDVMRRGAAGATWLKVRDARGIERQVTVDRSLRFDDSSAFRTTTREFTRLIDGGIRYIDATGNGSVDANVVMESRAVIIDLRGAATDGGIAATRRLLAEIAQPVARVVRRGASAPCLAATLRAAQAECPDERSSAPVLASGSGDESAFNGLVVVLIDERTDRRAELLALELEVAGARLLGNATAGAMAPASWLSLPGNLRIGIPLVEIRRADGGQLHRVGLTPHVELRPTLRSVRAGTDDVLDRAIAWVQQELSPAPRRRR